MEGPATTRCELSYVPAGERFSILEKDDASRQFSHIYCKRRDALQYVCAAAARAQWGIEAVAQLAIPKLSEASTMIGDARRDACP